MNRHPRRVFLASVIGSATSLAVASAQKREPAGDIGTRSKSSRCRVLPLPDDQTAVECGDREVLRWHFGAHYPRPFFYPFVGPSGVSLTRMGHPGAPDHDHHRSIWFAHRDVVGSDFWSDNTDNPGFPSKWHVREDGWMGASFCMDGERMLEPGQPLRLRYLLHAHQGSADGARAARIAEEFARAPFFAVTPSKAKHRQFELDPGNSVLH